MLEKFLNKNVSIILAQYAAKGKKKKKGTVTNINEKFIELDNDEVVAIKYIAAIKSI